MILILDVFSGEVFTLALTCVNTVKFRVRPQVKRSQPAHRRSRT